jgi:hypothetical protein
MNEQRLEEIRDLLAQLLAEAKATRVRHEEITSVYRASLRRQFLLGVLLVAAVVSLVGLVFWRYSAGE